MAPACLREAWAEWTCDVRWPPETPSGRREAPRKRYRFCHKQSVLFRHWFRGLRRAPCMAQPRKTRNKTPYSAQHLEPRLVWGSFFLGAFPAKSRMPRTVRRCRAPRRAFTTLDWSPPGERLVQRTLCSASVHLCCDAARNFAESDGSACSDMRVCGFRRFAGTRV
jgi:hypothetical protein